MPTFHRVCRIQRTIMMPLAIALAGLVSGAGGEEAETFVHAHGKLRIFYQRAGEHAVDGTDVNGNGVPDQVEDALLQIRAAQMLYVELLGFPDPFGSERYREVSYLDVTFLSREKLQKNGAAYDEIRRLSRPGDPEGTQTLLVALANTVFASKNTTPEHEFFHVIQNGATYFKNRWYTEGMARWSQRPFGSDGPPAERNLGEWPPSAEKQALLFGMTYESAVYFWKPLALRVEPEAEIPDTKLTGEIAAMRYADGTPVLKERRLAGWRLMREVLVRLGKEDDMALQKLGYDRWREEHQKSPQNNEFILGAVIETVKARETAGAR